MPVDLAGAVLGWAVGQSGTHGMRWARRLASGEDQERALRGVVGRAIERAAEIAPVEERERLRQVLIEHRATGIDAASVTSLRLVVSAWIEPLTQPVDVLDGESYLADHRIDRDGLVDALEREIREGIEADALTGGSLEPIAARFRHDHLAGQFELARRDIGELGGRIDAVIDEPPPKGPPRQLPHEQADFTGRVRELADLREQAAGERGTLVISAVSGIPGVGKSALALRVAHQLAERYPDAQLFANLRGGRAAPVDPGAVLGGFLRALGRRRCDIPVGAEERAAQYRSLLADKRALIVLDNATDEAQVRPLLPNSPGCVVLVTSRRDLALEGAHVLVLDPMDDDQGGELFARLIGAERVSAEPDAAAEVVRLCGGLPLAIRIVAARLRRRPRWTIAHLAERLSQARQRLVELRVGDLDVRASFTVSYEDLAAGEATLFRLLGVVATAEFDARLASALVTGGTEDADLLLEALADMHLIEAAIPGRYWIHDLLRLFAGERLEDEDGVEEFSRARDIMARWYATMVPAAVDAGILTRPGGPACNGSFPDSEAALAWLDAEWEAVLVAAEHAATLDDAGIGDAFLSLLHYLILRGNYDAQERLSRHFYESAPQHGRAEVAVKAAVQLGTVADGRGDYDAALGWCDAALRIAEEAQVHTSIVLALVNLLPVHLHRGDEAAARRVATRLEPFIEEVRDTGFASAAADTLARFEWQSDRRQGVKWSQRAYDLAIEEDNPAHAAINAYRLGYLAGGMGRRGAARQHWARAVEHTRRSSIPMAAEIRRAIGLCCMNLGWYEEACPHLDAARTLSRQLGDKSSEYRHVTSLAWAHLLSEHLEDAYQLFDDALAIAQELDGSNFVVVVEGMGLLGQATCELLRGRYKQAEALARDAYQLVRDVNERLAKQAQDVRFRARAARQQARRHQAGRKRRSKKRR